MPYDAICRLMAIVLGLGWATTAYAASTAPDLTGLPWAQIGVGTALALWGGLTFTAQRIIKGLRDGALVGPIAPALLLDLIVSGGNGFVVYGVGAWQEWGVWLLAISLFVGGYAGTRLLDAATARMIQAWAPKA